MIPLPLAPQTRPADPAQPRGEVRPDGDALLPGAGGNDGSLRTRTDAADFLLAVEAKAAGKAEGALPDAGETPSPHITVETLSPEDGPVFRLFLGEQPREGLLPVPTTQPAPAQSTARAADAAASESGTPDIMAPSRGTARAALAAGEQPAVPGAQAPALGDGATAETAPAKAEGADPKPAPPAASSRMQAAVEAAAAPNSASGRTTPADGAPTAAVQPHQEARPLQAATPPAKPVSETPHMAKADSVAASAESRAAQRAEAPLPGAHKAEAHPQTADVRASQAQKSVKIQAGDAPAMPRLEISASSGQPLTVGSTQTAAQGQAPVQASGPAAQLAPPAPGEAARQVADAIAMRSGERTMTLRLDPPDLGVVRVEFSFERHGVTALLSAENADTGSLLKRHTEWLQRELANSFGGASVSFGNGDAQAGNAAAEDRWRTLVLDRAAETAGLVQLPAASEANPLGLTGRIDIRL